MRVAWVPWLFALVAGALTAHADGPAPAAPAAAAAPAFADVAARLRQHDAPLWLHLRIEADGRFALRSAVDAEAVTWTERGAWRFTGAAEGDWEALRGLAAGLASARATEPPPTEPLLVETLEPEGYSMARLLVDVHAEAPWRHVLWTVQGACAPKLKVWQLTFLVPGAATWVDVDLPKVWGGGGVVDYIAEPVCGVEVRLLRTDHGTGLRAPMTRLYVQVLEKRLVGPVLEDVPGKAPDPKVLTGGAWPGDEALEQERAAEEGLSIRLPFGTARDSDRMGTFRRLTEYVAQNKSELRLVGEVKTPPQKDFAVPSADAIEVLVRLREAGCGTLQIEGAPPPVARKGGGR